MDLSARNQLKGTVKSVKLGAVMSEVVVAIGGQEIVAAITRGSVERLALQEGMEAIAVVKATDVMIGTGS
jgi:molybdopterin-binding protein